MRDERVTLYTYIDTLSAFLVLSSFQSSGSWKPCYALVLEGLSTAIPLVAPLLTGLVVALPWKHIAHSCGKAVRSVHRETKIVNTSPSHPSIDLLPSPWQGTVPVFQANESAAGAGPIRSLSRMPWFAVCYITKETGALNRHTQSKSP